ncbi:MAG: tetratricopeptide repeat protein [Prevotellaceae bacterium]|jgi:tetratricopeptide (TPR) repeat protein|nr:tetratricopeptide repeat protein [Prevotellaceae bacterium]
MKDKKNTQKKLNDLKEKEENEFLSGMYCGHASNTTERAIEHYLNVLKINPNRIDAHFLLGELYLHHAVRYFERVVAFNPEDADAHCCLGNAKAAAGYCWHARRELETALEINPDDANVCYDLSNNYRKTSEHDKAAEYLQKAMNMETKTKETLRNLPQASFAGMAQNNLPTATKIKKAKTLYNKGVAHQKQENHTQAIKYFQEALKANPACADACYRLALSYDRRNSHYLLLKYCMKTVEINPAHTDAWLKLSHLVWDNEAIYLQYLQKVVEIEFHDETIDRMISIYKKRGDSEQVIACYQKLLEKYPGDTIVIDSLAFEYRARNQPEKAIACFREISENNPQYARARVKMGYIYADTGDENSAVECFRQAAQSDNRRALAWLAGDKISKSRKAKLATLVKRYKWEDIEPVFIEEYQGWKKAANVYGLIFHQLQNITPVEDRDDMSIHIHPNEHNHVDAYKNHPQTPEEDQAYGLSIAPWGDWLGIDIAGTTIEDYSDEEIISHCLWEMTFFGYSQKTVQKTVDGWQNAEKEIQEENQKLPDVEKELENIKKSKK